MWETLDEKKARLLEEKLVLRRMEENFENEHVNLVGEIKFKGGDFNPEYQKIQKGISDQKWKIEKLEKEIEDEGGKSANQDEDFSIPEAEASFASGVDSGFGALKMGFGCGALVLIPIVLMMVLFVGVYLIIPAIIWLVFIKLRLFPSLFSGFERWTLFVGTTLWFLSLIFVLEKFDNQLFNPISSIILGVMLMMIIIEVAFRAIIRRKYRL